MMKYILRFLPEYHSTCLWPENKLARDTFSMPIAYEWKDSIGSSPMSMEEREALYQEGVSLQQMVKKELGSEFVVRDALDWIKPGHEKG